MDSRPQLRLSHGFPAECPLGASILILGSFPSEKSRQEGFYYAHPQNRFWPLLAAVFNEKTPQGIPAKKAFLSRHQLALYDVIDSCLISGSSDAAIKDVVPVDLAALGSFKRILLNGAKSAALFAHYLHAPAGTEVVALPSTSPANAAYSLDHLIALWGPHLR